MITLQPVAPAKFELSRPKGEPGACFPADIILQVVRT